MIDIGKTLAKASLWDAQGRIIDRATRPNARVDTGQYLALDLVGIQCWLTDTFATFARRALVGAIIPVAHGAAAVVLKDGQVAVPPFDYETPIPAEIRAAYARQRSPFAETGSPSLPDGLNLGAQLWWMQTLYPRLLEEAQLLLWPQYWSWLLSGVAASEVTSLGCHTDLWHCTEGRPSGLASAMGWEGCLPPMAGAGEVLGTILPAWAARTGLPVDTMVHCGLHDSNAALVAASSFPELATGDATVLSTGTWFLAMRMSALPVSINALDEERDCLSNVGVSGATVPSARWMGGREIASETDADTAGVDTQADQSALLAAVPAVVAASAMLLPAAVQGCGPFPAHAGRWINRPDDDLARRAAVCLYAAMVTHVALDLIGATRAILVEGRFAAAEVFVRALASLRPDDAIYVASAHNDVSFGAAKLVNPDIAPVGRLARVAQLDSDLGAYHARWTAAVGR